MLKVDGLHCGYGTEFSLRGVSFSLADGEFAALVGPNGSGKTTLIKTLSRILRPEQGRIVFKDKDVLRFGLREFARKVAVVTQDVNLSFDISVEEFIALGRIPHQSDLQFFESREDGRVIEEVIALTKTEKFRGRMINTLSGGERQLVMIARALAQEPELLLLDEPIVHLDICHQVEILELLSRLNREKGLTMIIVLHELNLASEYCRRLILLDNGRIENDGAPDRVLTPDAVEKVFKTKVLVEKNPQSGKPYLIVVSGNGKEREA